MTLADRLRQLAEALPPSGSVVLTRADLLELLGDAPTVQHQEEPGGDLTLEQVAEKVHRATSTVRSWCNRGEIPGAYRLRGRDWRIPPGALQAFLRSEANGDRAPHPRAKRSTSELGSWRKHISPEQRRQLG